MSFESSSSFQREPECSIRPQIHRRSNTINYASAIAHQKKTVVDRRLLLLATTKSTSQTVIRNRNRQTGDALRSDHRHHHHHHHRFTTDNVCRGSFGETRPEVQPRRQRPVMSYRAMLLTLATGPDGQTFADNSAEKARKNNFSRPRFSSAPYLYRSRS